MQNNLYAISKKDLFDLLGRLAVNSKVVVPYLTGDKLHFGEFDPAKEENIELGGIRQGQPLKSFISPVRERIIGTDPKDRRPLVIAGVKGCDLSSLVLQDFVFQGGDIEDPFYAESRKNTTIIAVDCTYARETCFCLAMEGAPYPRKFFDLSIASVDNYFLVEAGSPKGQKIVDDFRTFFKNAPAHAAEVRRSLRDKVAKQIEGVGMQIPGFRRDTRITERVLERYIPALAVIGGALVGALASYADLTGALGTGTGLLLTTMIIYNLYEQLAAQHMEDMHPALRRLIE